MRRDPRGSTGLNQTIMSRGGKSAGYKAAKRGKKDSGK